MTRIRLLSALLLAATTTPAAAQDFPAPGTGAFTWEVVGDRLLKTEAIAFGPDDTIYAGGLDSLYTLSLITGRELPLGRWQALPGRIPLGVNAILPLDPVGDTLLIGSAFGGRLDRSVEHGATWTMVNGPRYATGSGGPGRPGGFLVVPSGKLYAGRILAGGDLMYSDDRGATWVQSGSPLPPGDVNAGAFLSLPSGRVLAAGYWGVLSSDDTGASYARTAIFAPYGFLGDGLAALATPGSTQSGTPDCGQTDVSRCDGAVAVIGGPGGIGAYRTSDGGRTWSPPVLLPQPSDGIGFGTTPGVVALPPGPDGLGRAVAVLSRGMVYRTLDGAQTWEAIGRLPLGIEGNDWASYALMGPDGHLWVMTQRAGRQPHEIYRSAERLDEVLVVSGVAGLSNETGARIDVFPNPGHNQMTVRVSVSEPASGASVSVYDALGRRVATLHDGPLTAGLQSFPLDTSALSAGVYTVRCATAGAVASAQLTIVR